MQKKRSARANKIKRLDQISLGSGSETVNMQTSLAALYEEEWLLFRTDEGGERKSRGRGGEWPRC